MTNEARSCSFAAEDRRAIGKAAGISKGSHQRILIPAEAELARNTRSAFKIRYSGVNIAAIIPIAQLDLPAPFEVESNDAGLMTFYNRSFQSTRGKGLCLQNISNPNGQQTGREASRDYRACR